MNETIQEINPQQPNQESVGNGQVKCPKCGATDISLNVKTGKLRCNYCRHEFEQIKTEQQQDLSKLSGQSMTQGVQNINAEASNMVTLKCSSCGAEVVIDTSEALQARCHWCRNTLSINDQIPNGAVPDLVLPFHITKEDLEQFYYKMYEVYERIFRRIGMKNFVSVESDSGMMGGNVSHEFMLLTPAGEDTIVLCDKCSYRANREVANAVVESYDDNEEKIKLVNTPNKKTIEEVCAFLNKTPKQSCKAVCYAIKGDENKSVVAFIRGDLEVNEAKLCKVIQKEVVANDLTDNKCLVAGFIGPYQLNVDKNTILVFDKSLKGLKNVVCGGNKTDYHYTGISFERDLNVQYCDIANVEEGMVCPVCGKGHLYFNRGIEIGNIFQLGTKYTQSMNMKVHSNNGEDIYPIMGCYGIGVGRALASVLEENSDENGLIFPMSITPWHVYLCPLRYQDKVIQKATDKIYNKLTNANIDVILDDREVSPGNKFAESELMGMPIRIVVSSRSLANGEVEVTLRASGEKIMVKTNEVVSMVKNIIKQEMAKLN